MKKIAASRAGREPRATGEDDGLDELVRHPRLVARLDGRDGIGRLRALAAHDRGRRPLRALGPVVAVHRVVAADNRGDPLRRQAGEVGRGGVRRDVAAVREGVDPRPLLHPLAACQLEQREQVVEVRVDASLGDEAEQVNVPSTLPCPCESADERGVVEEGAVPDREVDPHQVLEEHAAGADREVPHLGVPHLAGGQADGLARGGERRVWEQAPEGVEDRRLGEVDGVPRARRGEAPAIEDDERYEREAAVRHRLEKDAGSSEAPPTRAPSMSGCASSSAAFSGLTEPP